jgi:ammonia channel protein AmtB
MITLSTFSLIVICLLWFLVGFIACLAAGKKICQIIEDDDDNDDDNDDDTLKPA